MYLPGNCSPTVSGKKTARAPAATATDPITTIGRGFQN